MKEPKKIYIPVVPEISAEHVQATMRQVETQVRESIAALAPLMDQLGKAFLEFGRAGQALADRLHDMSRMPFHLTPEERARQQAELDELINLGAKSREELIQANSRRFWENKQVSPVDEPPTGG